MITAMKLNQPSLSDVPLVKLYAFFYWLVESPEGETLSNGQVQSY